MSEKKVHTRRDVSKQLGMAAGFALIPVSFVNAATVTPSQVKGPFHPVDEQSDTDMNLVTIEGHAEPAMGEVILVRGQVFDSDGVPLEDALVDVWQANDAGRYAHPRDKNTAPLDPNFQGWGMVKTDAEGRYGIKTIKPGPYPLSFLGGKGWRCRHIHFEISHSNFETLVTQMYFKGDPLIETDQEIIKAPEELRHLLIAEAQTDEASGLPLYSFDLVLARGQA